MYYDQSKFDIRCEWGEKGVAALAAGCDVVVIVDVFSFSTTVDIALARGATVFPFRCSDPAAAENAARERRAELVDRRGGGKLSFSPKSMLDVPIASRLMLRSANGATLSLMTGTTPTVAGCLRNRAAVAEYAGKFGRKIAVIPAGERWEDGSLRPAVEDWIAAGAIIAKLPGERSPEASAAAAAFEAMGPNLELGLKTACSGVELFERHYENDAELAAKLDCSPCVPRLVDGAYVNAALREAIRR